MKTLAAAALAFRVGIAEDELGPDIVLHEVHLGAHQHHQRLRVDDNSHVCSPATTIDLHDLVQQTRFSRVVQGVAQAVAAALLDADLQPQLSQPSEPRGRSFATAGRALGGPRCPSGERRLPTR